ncbi:hypothetical protein HZF05_14295 [Sphingomonas sp. CGMCC 1.13654]|uniref:Uncharacterized protein n=1 Tax=Sphingomonas chungangi TaxID=2683589 RepID=A0A838L965_9SPHN|nr:hypothetical protein [Sphingomonas chungangi]MBA2935255.1 hypothetical protein [Sphingomonas chungangi]MVW55334.1 hypothetical protein [Sphingomonas chungangi]
MQSAGIRLHYPSLTPLPDGVKDGLLVEADYALNVALYYREQPPFGDLLARISGFAARL